jgi:hypothetical protein
MKQHLTYSSEVYLLKVAELAELPKASAYFESGAVTLLLSGKRGVKDALLSGAEFLQKLKQQNEEFCEVKIAYYSYNPFIGFLLQLFKPIKRKHITAGTGIYKTKLSHLIAHHLPRGIRTRANAYCLKNKKWQIPAEERIKKYNDLFASLKNGYDFAHPLFVGLNRQIGFKDKLVDGHHRIGICQDLKIDEVSISFWTYPPSFLKFFIR